ncbi:Uncharacterised protein [Mycobacteroides abscessus subsp. abscessus]|nr:Uncharacterised protein [Mycobacteroides abscessus subsp. abscessus]
MRSCKGELASDRNLLDSEMRTVSPLRPWCQLGDSRLVPTDRTTEYHPTSGETANPGRGTNRVVAASVLHRVESCVNPQS